MKKQKTLEEAAENHLQKWRLLNNIHLSNILHAERCKNDFIAGAKWQAERSYSEEDMISYSNYVLKQVNSTAWELPLSPKELFTKFIKKA